MKIKYPKTKKKTKKLAKINYNIGYTKPKNVKSKINALKLVYKIFGFIKRYISDIGKL